MKQTLPYLTPYRLLTLGRQGSDFTRVECVVNVDGQTLLPELVHDQMSQLINVDLEINKADFTRLWKSLLLKRCQDVYEKERFRRATNFIRVGHQIPVPAPLADLTFALGSYFCPANGITYDVVPPVKGNDPPNWWEIDLPMLNRWNRTCARMKDLYHMREFPTMTDWNDKPLSLCVVTDDDTPLRTVKSPVTGATPTDSLIALVNNQLFNPQVAALNNCHISLVESVNYEIVAGEYVASYVTGSNN